MRDPNATEQANAFAQPAPPSAPDWWMAAAAPFTPATAATGQTAAGQASAMRGVGGPGWNEEFDQDWANRMMKIYGVSMEDLRDPGTRRSLNRQQREARQETPRLTTPPVPPGTGGPEPLPPQSPISGTTGGPAGNPSEVYWKPNNKPKDKIDARPTDMWNAPAPTGPVRDEGFF